MTESIDERAVSPVAAYVLTLGVTAMLIGGLMIASGSFVDDHRQSTAQSELKVLGQQLSADLAAADRLSRSEGTSETSIQRSLPTRVVGSHYTVSVRHGGDGPTDPYLELEAPELDISVTVGVTSLQPVPETTVDGGDVVVEYSNGELVIQNA